MKAVALMAEISGVIVVLPSEIVQTGVTPQLFAKVNVQAVTDPPPIVIAPPLSVPTTEPFGVDPQVEIVGIGPP